MNYIMCRTYTYIPTTSDEGMIVEKINGKIIDMSTGHKPPVCITCFHTEGIYSFCRHK